jgi:hypothetical protein
MSFSLSSYSISDFSSYPLIIAFSSCSCFQASWYVNHKNVYFKLIWPSGVSIWLMYCHVSGDCVTNKTGFGFDDRIYWTFVQLVTTSSQINIWQTVIFFRTGHSTGTILTSSWTPLYSVVLRCTPLYSFNSDLNYDWLCPLINSQARTPRKTPYSVVKNACLLVRYPVNVLLLLRAYASGMCLRSCCLAMGICVISYT